MNEIIFVFSIIVQLSFDFRFNLIATFLQLCCDLFSIFIISKPLNIEVNNFHYTTPRLKFVGKFSISWCLDVIRHQKWENTNVFV